MRAIKVEDVYGEKVVLVLAGVVEVEGPNEEGVTSLRLIDGRCLQVIDEYEDLLRRLGWRIVE